MEENKRKFLEYFSSVYNDFKNKNKSVIGTAHSVFTKACKELEDLEKIYLIADNNLKFNIENVDQIITTWDKKIEKAAQSDLNEIEKFKTMIDDSKENMDLIRKKSKTIYNSFLLNPYFILGLSINATQSQAMMVRDKVEKYNKLKITKVLTSDFDLRNIDKPVRDLSTIQSAISSLKDITQKFFWFNNNEYCKIWESKLLFDWLKNDKCNLDLMLACYFHLLVKDIDFTMTNEWNTFICALNDFYKLSNDKIFEILAQQNRCSETDENNDIPNRFKSIYVEPFLTCLEYLDLSELKKFLNTIDILDGGDPLLDYYTERLIQKSDKIQIKISNLGEEKSKDIIVNYDFINNLGIVKAIKKFVLDNYESSSIYVRRISDIYEQATINSIVVLNGNDRQKDALIIAKDIYKEASPNLKRRLRSMFDYSKLGASISDLTPIEMHDLGAKYYEGKGVRKNLSTALKWYTRAANAGYGRSMVVVALCYLNGTGCTTNKVLAKKYLEMAVSAGESSALTLLNNMHMPHEHYDLGYISVPYTQRKIVEVRLSYIGYVRLLDDDNYDKYQYKEPYEYYGGIQTENPCLIEIPHSDHWHCVIDNNGDDLGAIKSYSCYVKTIRDSYY